MKKNNLIYIFISFGFIFNSCFKEQEEIELFNPEDIAGNYSYNLTLSDNEDSLETGILSVEYNGYSEVKEEYFYNNIYYGEFFKYKFVEQSDNDSNSKEYSVELFAFEGQVPLLFVAKQELLYSENDTITGYGRYEFFSGLSSVAHIDGFLNDNARQITLSYHYLSGNDTTTYILKGSVQ